MLAISGVFAVHQRRFENGVQASKSTSDDLTSLEKLFQTWKQGLFGVLFVMSNDASESKYRAWFIVLFHQLQVHDVTPGSCVWRFLCLYVVATCSLHVPLALHQC